MHQSNSIKKVCICISLIMSSILCAQTYQRGFSSARYMGIHELSSGNYLCIGFPSGSLNDNRLLLHRISSYADLLESKVISGAQGLLFYEFDNPSQMVLPVGDSLFISPPYSTISGNSSLYPGMLSMDTSGNVGWWKSYTNTLSNSGQNPRGGINQSILSSDNHFINFGWFNPANVGETFNYFPAIQKTDIVGNELWKFSFAPLLFEFFRGGCQLDDGHILAVGGSDSSLVTKVDIDGNLLWSNIYHIAGSYGSKAMSCMATSDGGAIIVGTTSTILGDKQGYILKINSSGDILWVNSYGGQGDDYFFKVKETSDGGYIVCGRTNSFGAGQHDGLLLKVSSNGSIDWFRVYGVESDEYLNDVIETSDGNFVAVGSSADEGWFLKTDSFGFVECHQSAPIMNAFDIASTTFSSSQVLFSENNLGFEMVTPSTDAFISSNDLLTVIDSTICEGNSYNFNGTLLNSPGTYFDTLSGRLACDSVIQLNLSVTYAQYVDYLSLCFGDSLELDGIWYNSADTIVSNTSVNEYGCDSTYIIYLDVMEQLMPTIVFSNYLGTENIYAAYQWYFENSPINGAIEQTYIPQVNGNYSVSVVDSNGCYGISSPFIVDFVGQFNKHESQIILYPNPSDKSFKIQSDLTNYSVMLRDLNGRLLFHTQAEEFYVGDLEPGVYVVCIITRNGRVIRRKLKII